MFRKEPTTLSASTVSKGGVPSYVHMSDRQREELARTLLVSLPDKRRESVVRKIIIGARIKKSFATPLPSPADFEKYNQVFPGISAHIIAVAEKEQEFYQEAQDKILAMERIRIYGSILISTSLILVASAAIWKGELGIAILLGLAVGIGKMVKRLAKWLHARKSSGGYPLFDMYDHHFGIDRM